MRGKDEQQLNVFSYVSPEQRVPQDHPLRVLRAMTDEALQQLQPRFHKLYAKTGRPSIAPEKLLRALLLQALYSVRSERLLMEQLDYNLLFRWFVGLNMDDAIWDVSVFTKNRERLLDGNIAEAFFQAVLRQARERSLLSDEHFTVDGTPERDAALVMLEQIPGTKQVSVGGDKAYDTADFVAECRNLKVTPHVAQNLERPGGSAIDARTTQHAGYAISQRKRKRVEECFGWLKTIALLRKVRHRGVFKVGWVFTFAAAAYNLVRMRNLAIQA